MKSYLFAVFLLTICVVFVESAPTQNDESATSHTSHLLRDLGVTLKPDDECYVTSVQIMEGYSNVFPLTK